MTPPIDPNKELTISYLTMRKAIGWLGMLLPVILLAGNYCINKFDLLNNSLLVQTKCYNNPYTAGYYAKSSISHYYYSTVGELFTGTLSAVALFMFCYKGHPKREGEKWFSDSAMTNFAGFFAMGVIIFPTSADPCISDNIRSFLSSELTGGIHLGFAALFFSTLALMSMINFRRTGDQVSFGKKKEHKTYVVCGVIMFACIGLIALYSLLKRLEFTPQWLENWLPVYWLEAFALVAFGFSWLKKGQVDVLYVPKMLGLVGK